MAKREQATLVFSDGENVSVPPAGTSPGFELNEEVDVDENVDFSGLPPSDGDTVAPLGKSFPGNGGIFSGGLARSFSEDSVAPQPVAPQHVGPKHDEPHEEFSYEANLAKITTQNRDTSAQTQAERIQAFLDQQALAAIPQVGVTESILGLLPEAYRIQIEQMARARGVGSTEIITAIIAAIGERGELSDMEMNPLWPEMLQHISGATGTSSVVQANPGHRRTSTALTCKGCSHVFPLPPKQYSQDYCCTGCGLSSNPLYSSQTRPPHSPECKTEAARIIANLTAKRSQVQQKAA